MKNYASGDQISENVSRILSDSEDWAAMAAQHARDAFRQAVDVSFKSDESPVTVIDQFIERELKKAISAKYPEDGIFGEESGVDGEGARNLWVVDPIDGTRSFISGNPLFGMLLAYVKDGTPFAGTISMPILDEIYAGGRGRGTTRNGVPVQVSGQINLDESVLYINEGEKLIAERPAQLERLLKAGRTRRFGYDCYPHALLAAGHVDAVIDYDLKPYDYFALAPVVEAAGGVITDWKGDELTMSSDGTVVSAASSELHADLIDLLK